MRSNVLLQAYNRGVVSNIALARTDIERLALSASIQKNWMPRTLGSMMLRPGLGYKLNIKDDNEAHFLPFIFSTTDTALIELTDTNMRVIVDDAVLSRPSVATTITNGTFVTDLTGWTDNDEAGASSVYSAGDLFMQGTSSTQARITQALTIAGGDQGVLHGIVVTILQGIASIKVGSTSGDDDYLSATFLGEGEHHLAFIPTAGTAYLDISCATTYPTIVASVVMEAGEVNITTPWATANLDSVRPEQSGDVIYCDCSGIHPYKIERRANNSWSVLKFQPIDGPFRNINNTQIAITPIDISGDITVSASSNFFKDGHLGALFYHDSVGQQVKEAISAEDTFSDPIRVSGISTSRQFSIIRAGTWSATLTLQRSVAEPGAWTDIATYTTNGTTNFNDGLDNQIIYYRVGVKSGDFTSGTLDASMTYGSGSITGVFRVTAVNSPTSIDAIVVKDLGGTNTTRDWGEGAWSELRGYPSACALYEGRLWHAGKGFVYGSVSDAYESFDPDYEGDAGPINRSIGYGPVDSINWLLPMQRLLLGTDGAEIAARSTSFDEPLTPTNFNLKSVSTQGSANVQPVIVDKKGLFLQRNTTRVYELAYDERDFDYTASDLTVLTPDFCEPGVVKMVVQRQPDTRVHCIRSDGTVALLVFDRAESVICWVDIETDGAVEDAVVLPGAIEDDVYYAVKRVINGSTKRFLEKFAPESECTGLPVGKLADSFVYYSGSAVTTITGLSHLEGETVVVWGWNTVTPFTDTLGNTIGKDFGTFVVTSGQITGISQAVTDACVGLGYSATYQSTKLAYGAQAGTALAQRKKVTQLALLLLNTHIGGLQFGRDFNHLHSLNRKVSGRDLSADTIVTEYDQSALGYGDQYDTDSRLCLKANAPKPCTVLACVIGIETHEKV